MNILDWVKSKFVKLNNNPEDGRLTYINNLEDLEKQEIREYKIWYVGDSNELLNFYTENNIQDNNKNPIYNRNRKNYFWGISATEADIKRTHSGVPNAIVYTLVNVVGLPRVNEKNEEINEKLAHILEENNFEKILNQQQLPLTLVEGWGAFKINVKKEFRNVPIIQYYEAEDVEFLYQYGELTGIIFKDYYRYGNKNYVLYETRRKENGNSYISYSLFELGRGGEAKEIPLNTIPELESLEDLEIRGYNKIIGVPTKFLFDVNNKNYGRSIFKGKIDLFDDLDQILSQDSQTVRVSTPVGYYPVDILERSANGLPKVPKLYNRQYIKKESIPNGDGVTDGQIQTTQPELNFEKYNEDAKEKLSFILMGILSPATLGVDVSKKDNAEAQREKEKITIMTRNAIVREEKNILKRLCELLLDMQEYLDTGKITQNAKYEINVEFDEFANPSLEQEIKVLGDAYAKGVISTERYVNTLWGDKITKEEKEKEIAWLENDKIRDNLLLSDIENEQEIRTNRGKEEEAD